MKQIGSQEFEAEVLLAPGPVLVDFFTDGCRPCQNMVPVLEEVGRDLAGRLKILKVDAGAEGELAGRYRVQHVPTFFLFKKGDVAAQRVGSFSKRALLEWLESEGVR